MNYPLIVFRQGNSAWVAQTYIAPYIIDVAFLGDRLYAITQAEDLMPLNLALDGDGKPMVTRAEPAKSGALCEILKWGLTSTNFFY
jgi:hypothetical protein